MRRLRGEKRYASLMFSESGLTANRNDGSSRDQGPPLSREASFFSFTWARHFISNSEGLFERVGYGWKSANKCCCVRPMLSGLMHPSVSFIVPGTEKVWVTFFPQMTRTASNTNSTLNPSAQQFLN